jgi:hypothetical protein
MSPYFRKVETILSETESVCRMGERRGRVKRSRWIFRLTKLKRDTRLGEDCVLQGAAEIAGLWSSVSAFAVQALSVGAKPTPRAALKL